MLVAQCVLALSRHYRISASQAECIDAMMHGASGTCCLDGPFFLLHGRMESRHPCTIGAGTGAAEGAAYIAPSRKTEAQTG